MMSYTEDEVSMRPKLSLQPKGSGVDQATPLIVKNSRPNPFGTARPREQVIAEREGKKETEVLKEQAQKEWKPSIVLTEAQREEKKAAEGELAFVKSELMKEFDPVQSKALKEEVAAVERKLEELLGTFETAQIGGARRSYDQRRDEERGPATVTPGCVNYAGDTLDSYSNFSRTRERDVDRGGSYGDTWGAKGGSTSGSGGRLNSSQCFSCGEMGHFSRECPNAGCGCGPGRGHHASSYGGGGKSVNRLCYTCGQEGHFSRECRQSFAYGFRSGDFGNICGGTYGSSTQRYEGNSYSNQGAGSDGYLDRYMHGALQGRGGYSTGYGN